MYTLSLTILDGQLVISPEFVAKKGTGGWAIDFLFPPNKWGFELPKDRDRLVEHMKRFEVGGKYYRMIQSRAMEDYIVLDFTVVKLVKPRLGITPLPYLSLD